MGMNNENISYMHTMGNAMHLWKKKKITKVIFSLVLIGYNFLSGNGGKGNPCRRVSISKNKET